MNVLVTGAAGFIGYHLSKELIRKNHSVLGFDNLNNYYDKNLKISRLEDLKEFSKDRNNFKFKEGDIADKSQLNEAFNVNKPKIIFNLAAQAGVRYSIENPMAYIQSNIVGFTNVLELSVNYSIDHLIYASSSSVYGGNKNFPFKESQGVNHPISIYATSKRSNELMAHTYSHLYDLPTTGLRFFTVYGPWGRPDMALFKFTKKIINNEKIEVFNNGKMLRDFTYIDDITTSLVALMEKPPSKNNNFDTSNPLPNKSWSPFNIFNVGNSNPIQLMDYVKAIEKALNKKASIDFLPMQPGDVEMTYANSDNLYNWIKYRPSTSINEGIKNFVKWYKEYFGY